MDRPMNRTQVLAAELVTYSYAHSPVHLGVNIRFDELMPQTVLTLEKAEAEEWPLKELARELEVDSQQAEDLHAWVPRSPLHHCCFASSRHGSYPWVRPQAP